MDIEAVVRASFHGEIQAFKPGNVSIYADGHDMVVDDFLHSAEVAAPLICRSEWPYGQRLLQAVTATRAAVGCNTNLGMLLLFTPLVMAAELGVARLRENLCSILASFSMEDATLLFKAISLASPGGLGEVEQHDVSQAADCSVLQAMAAAQTRDSVALQYVNNYEHVFELGYSTIKGFVKDGNSVEWAVVACYLTLMAAFPDSHIARKFGTPVAEQVQQQSGAIKNQFTQLENPADAKGLLSEFDAQLKEKKINPGTSADLAATSLLVYNLAHFQE